VKKEGCKTDWVRLGRQIDGKISNPFYRLDGFYANGARDFGKIAIISLNDRNKSSTGNKIN